MRSVSLCSHVPAAVAFALMTVALPASAPALARQLPIIPPDRVLTGPIRIIDGDTVDIAGVRVRLEGIDAPEVGQTCQNARGETWDCGNAATRMLVSLLSRANASCKAEALDAYGRVLAVCFAGGIDVNAEMVRLGYAWAFVKYSSRYVGEESQARVAKAGIWQGPAIAAWDYRARRWTASEPTAPHGCAIKGNVSRSGLVYHMPWSPWYERVVMRPDKGTRWFCTEAEAVAAGWRPAMMR